LGARLLLGWLPETILNSLDITPPLLLHFQPKATARLTPSRGQIKSWRYCDQQGRQG
jgi:hypothetical protein